MAKRIESTGVGGIDENHATAAELVPLVYESLRRLARERMGYERPGHTLQATALVHEAYVRLTRTGDTRWNSPGHFYGAAAEAMRRILVERARRYSRLKHGAGLARIDLDEDVVSTPARSPELLALDRYLDELERVHPRKARVVMLRYFAGCSIVETAELIGLSVATVKLDWAFARAWLEKRLAGTLVD